MENQGKSLKSGGVRSRSDTGSGSTNQGLKPRRSRSRSRSLARSNSTTTTRSISSRERDPPTASHQPLPPAIKPRKTLLQSKLIGLSNQNVVLLPFGIMSAMFAVIAFGGGIYCHIKLVKGQYAEWMLWDPNDCDDQHTPLNGFTDACTAFKQRQTIAKITTTVAVFQFFVGLGTAVAGLFAHDKLMAYLTMPYVLAHAIFGVIYVLLVVLLYDIYYRRYTAERFNYDAYFWWNPRNFVIESKGYFEYDRLLRLWDVPNPKEEQYGWADVVKFIVAFNAMFCLISCETLFGIAAVLFNIQRRRPSHRRIV